MKAVFSFDCIQFDSPLNKIKPLLLHLSRFAAKLLVKLSASWPTHNTTTCTHMNLISNNIQHSMPQTLGVSPHDSV